MKENINRSAWKPLQISTKEALKKKNIVDQYTDLLEELFLLRNPKYRFDKNYQEHLTTFIKSHTKNKNTDHSGVWFYYPWLDTTIHFLSEKDHLELRTARNKNLITKEEQEKFYNSTISILGMSVGSHVALTIALTGGAKRLKLADPDIIGGSNLNRIRTGYQNIGLKKVIAVARQIYEINPYAVIEIFPDGITEKNTNKILKGIDLLIEEMDNPYFKLKVRELARPLGIPVIMAADNHDSVIADIERFDKKKNYPILHGIMGKITANEFKKISPQDLPKTIAKMAGAQLSTLRMLESVTQVGKTIYSWPQLGTAATLCGSVLAQLSRRILVGENVPSGRFDVNLEKIFTETKEKDTKKKEKILKLLGIE